MSERLAEIERRMKECLGEIEGLRARRLALYGVSYPKIETKERFYTSPEEWDRLAKIALLEGKISALEAEYSGLRIQRVTADLDGHVEREIERAKREASMPHKECIGRGASREVTERLDKAERSARSEIREIRLRYMTGYERADHERRQRERQQERRREHEQEHGYER